MTLNNQIMQNFQDIGNPQDRKGNGFYDVEGETKKINILFLGPKKA